MQRAARGLKTSSPLGLLLVKEKAIKGHKASGRVQQALDVMAAAAGVSPGVPAMQVVRAQLMRGASKTDTCSSWLYCIRPIQGRRACGSPPARADLRHPYRLPDAVTFDARLMDHVTGGRGVREDLRLGTGKLTNVHPASTIHH